MSGIIARIGWRRALWWSLLFLTVLPAFIPFQFPVSVTEPTIAYHSMIEALEPGDVVLVPESSTYFMWPEIKAAAITSMELLFDKPGVKIIMLGMVAEGPVLLEDTLTYLPNLDKKIYGEDYVLLGFAPGGMSAARALAKDIRSIFQVDYYGNNIDDLPVMDGVNDYTDFKMINSFAICPDTQFIYTWRTQYQVPVNQVLVAVCIPFGYSLWRATLMSGMIPGARGCAELEVLTNKPGLGLQSSDALTTSHLWFLAMLILGNLVYYKDRITGGN
jgi:hypothetical protein